MWLSDHKDEDEEDEEEDRQTDRLRIILRIRKSRFCFMRPVIQL